MGEHGRVNQSFMILALGPRHNLQRTVKEQHARWGCNLWREPTRVSGLKVVLDCVLITRSIVHFQEVPDINLLEWTLDGDNLLLGVKLQGREDPKVQVRIIVQRIRSLILLVTESTHLMRPLRHGFFSNPKQFLQRWDNRQKRRRTTGEQVKGDDSFGRPGMKGNMTLQEDSNARDSRWMELVTMIAQHRQTSSINSIHHGFREAFFRIKEISIDAFDIHQEMLTRRLILH
mmetsp:Transcript_7085/g.16202  ORF Transcript_7085/g.16202 Transcript_7085/m.16202 type:complete len:231 (+) Transcript_7085:2743-3435(+)